MADIDINSLVIGDSIALDINESDPKKPASSDASTTRDKSTSSKDAKESSVDEESSRLTADSKVEDPKDSSSDVDESSSDEDVKASEEPNEESIIVEDVEETAIEDEPREVEQLSFEEAVESTFSAATPGKPTNVKAATRTVVHPRRRNSVRKRASHAVHRSTSQRRRRYAKSASADIARTPFSREFFSIIIALICAFLLIVSNSLAWADQAKREEARLLAQDTMFTRTVNLYPADIDLMNIHPAITDPVAYYLAKDGAGNKDALATESDINPFADFSSVPIYGKLYEQDGVGSLVIRTTNVDESDEYGALQNGFGPMDSTLHGLSIKKLVNDDVLGINQIIIKDDFPSTAIPSVDFSLLSNCSKIVGLEKVDVSNVVQFDDCFSNDLNLTELDLTSWNVSNAVSIKGMFSECEKLVDLDVSNWDTSKVKDFSNAFFSCDSLKNLNVSNWDTSSAISFVSLFQSCIELESLNLSKWDTSKVQSINLMFNACENLKSINVANWDTRNIKMLNTAFANCTSLTSLDLSSWQITSEAQEMSNLFAGCSSLSSVDVSNWNTSNVKSMRNVFKGCSRLSELDLGNWVTSSVTDMEGMFDGCSGLQNLDVSKFNTSKVSNMRRMFFGCSSLFTLNISNFDLAELTSAPAMFSNCLSLTSLDLRPFKAAFKKSKAKVELNDNTFSMFTGCGSLTSIDISDWDLSRVENFNYLFKDCDSLKSVTLSSTMTNAKTMRSMFENCASLEMMDLTTFPSDSITDMSSAFKDCSALKSVTMLAKTDKVERTVSLFEGCSHLASVDMEDRTFAMLFDINRMFYRCTELKEVDLSHFDTSAIEKKPDTAARKDVFAYCVNLQKVSLGKDTTPIKLPTPDSKFIDGATGVWQDETGTKYDGDQIPVGKAGVYTAEIDESVIGVPKPVEGDPDCQHQPADKFYVISEPTCNTGGIERHLCTLCPAVYDVEVSHLEHDFEKDEVTSATCLLPGYTEKVCIRCGFSSGHFDHQEPLGHLMDEHGVETQATCTEPGYTTYSCQRGDCEYEEVKNEIPAHGHHLVLVSEMMYPTCDSPGRYEFRQCDRPECGFTDGGELIDALGHEWTSPAWTWAPDYSAASIKVQCNRDANHVLDTRANIETRNDTGSTVIMADATYGDDVFYDAVRKFDESSFVVRGEPVVNGFDAAYVPDEDVPEGQSAVLRVEKVETGDIHKTLSDIVDVNKETILAGVYSAELFIGDSPTPVHDGFGSLTLLIPVVEAPGVSDPAALEGLEANVYHCHKNDKSKITMHDKRIVENGVVVLNDVEDLSTFATEVMRPADVPPPGTDDPPTVDTYNVTASAINGTVTPTELSVKKGSEESVTFTYNSSGNDYTLSSIKVNDKVVEGASDKTSGSYTLTAINQDTNVVVEFNKIQSPPGPGNEGPGQNQGQNQGGSQGENPGNEKPPVSDGVYTIKAKATNGTVAPEEQSIPKNSNGVAILTYTPLSEEYMLSSITVNGKPAPSKGYIAPNVYQLSDVKSDTNVEIIFTKVSSNGGTANPSNEGNGDNNNYSSNAGNSYKGLANTGSTETLLGLFGIVVAVILVLGATFLVMKRRRL